MSTGDIKNNLRKLKAELRKICYQDIIDVDQMNLGISTPFLPILHFVFMDYSLELSTYFTNKGYECYGKSDLRFLEVIYKIIVQEFNMKPMLTKHQFFTVGFAEIKIIFVTTILKLCQEKLKSITLKKPVKKKTLCTNFGPSLTKSIVKADEKTSKNSQQLVTVSLENGIFPPQPTASLALTPMKEIPTQSKYTEEKDNLACSLLDVTEVESISDDTVSQVEVVDVSDDEMLPKFVVTKHTDVVFLKHNEQYDQILSNGKHKKRLSASKELFSMRNAQKREALNGNYKSLPDYSFKECKECALNTKEIGSLKEKVGDLEKQMFGVINVNNELSAKLILMEMKFKVLENAFNGKNSTPTEMQSATTVLEDGTNNENILLDGKQTYPQNRNDSCSPVKYSGNDQISSDNDDDDDDDDNDDDDHDDDVIMQNFKPIRMSDIQQSYSNNKENLKSIKHARKSLSQGNKNNVCFDTTNSDPAENTYHVLVNSVDNLKNDISDTKQIVLNVKQKLMETERLLKLGSKK